MNAEAIDNRLINIHELADVLGCSERHIRNMVKAGDIPKPRKVGNLTRWSHNEMQSWIAAGCPSAEHWGQSEFATTTSRQTVAVPPPPPPSQPRRGGF